MSHSQTRISVLLFCRHFAFCFVISPNPGSKTNASDARKTGWKHLAPSSQTKEKSGYLQRSQTPPAVSPITPFLLSPSLLRILASPLLPIRLLAKPQLAQEPLSAALGRTR